MASVGEARREHVTAAEVTSRAPRTPSPDRQRRATPPRRTCKRVARDVDRIVRRSRCRSRGSSRPRARRARTRGRESLSTSRRSRCRACRRYLRPGLPQAPQFSAGCAGRSRSRLAAIPHSPRSPSRTRGARAAAHATTVVGATRHRVPARPAVRDRARVSVLAAARGTVASPKPPARRDRHAPPTHADVVLVSGPSPHAPQLIALVVVSGLAAAVATRVAVGVGRRARRHVAPPRRAHAAVRVGPGARPIAAAQLAASSPNDASAPAARPARGARGRRGAPARRRGDAEIALGQLRRRRHPGRRLAAATQYCPARSVRSEHCTQRPVDASQTGPTALLAVWSAAHGVGPESPGTSDSRRRTRRVEDVGVGRMTSAGLSSPQPSARSEASAVAANARWVTRATTIVQTPTRSGVTGRRSARAASARPSALHRRHGPLLRRPDRDEVDLSARFRGSCAQRSSGQRAATRKAAPNSPPPGASADRARSPRGSTSANHRTVQPRRRHEREMH